MKLLLVSLILIANAYSAEEVYIKTDGYSVKTSKQFRRSNNPQFCRFETKINKEKNQLELRVGVIGSPASFFGWNMPINLQDLPFVEGFTREYKSAGVTGMVMTYSNGTLNFKKIKSEKVWNRLYPFSIRIDANLTSPKAFKGTLMGYERTTFGSLKKHVQSKCDF